MQKENTIYRKVNRGFQITLPPTFREKFNLAVGSSITMTLDNDKLVIEPHIDQKTISLNRLHAIFNELDILPKLADSEEAVLKLVNQERKLIRGKR